MRKCAVCSEDFDPKGTTRKFCSRDHYKSCEVCGNDFFVKDLYRFDKKKSCSTACKMKLIHTDEAKAKAKATSLERYGTERPQQSAVIKAKTAKTNQAKYGADWPNQNAEVRERGYGTNRERYGVDHPLQNEELRKKAGDTLEEKYGERHPSLVPELRRKAEDVFEKKHGVRHTWQSEEVKAKIRAVYLERYGVEYPSQESSIKAKAVATYEEGLKNGRHSVGARVSKRNLALGNLISTAFPGTTVTYEKALDDKSFDIAIDGTNVLIELNPTVTHNTQFSFACVRNGCALPCDKHSPRPNDYHYRRALAAREAGYSLIQIYDWDSEEQVLRLLSGRLGRDFTRYSARKLTRVKLTQKQANAFLDAAHIQGGMKGQKHCYGLKNAEDQLVAVATFGPSRFKAKEQYEWLRYAVAPNTIVHGGPNGLWRAFVDDVKPESVISYVSFDHSTSPNLFLSGCGFTEDSPTGPSLVWSKSSDRIYNNSLLKLGADRLLGTSYGSVSKSGLKNNEIMLLESWLPIYTAGNRIFRWTAPE